MTCKILHISLICVIMIEMPHSLVVCGMVQGSGGEIILEFKKIEF